MLWPQVWPGIHPKRKGVSVTLSCLHPQLFVLAAADTWIGHK